MKKQRKEIPDIIINQNMLQQYKDDIKVYAMYVNRIRMIPSIKDGLKFIHRRIVFCTYKYERAINTSVKSSAIVGTVMKRVHPHGDSSIYDAMRPLTNWFEINMPLLEGSGNWGNFQGDTAAAQRYTESKLSEFCLDTVISELKDDENVVDWTETYDGKGVEPDSLPVALPLLLINGGFGIGYGIKVEIPRHNITEVIDATLNLIQNPNAPVFLIPDQCMPCEIIESDFKGICNKGNGRFTVRGIIETGEFDGYPALFIKSCPDLVFLNSITDKIEQMHADKKLPQVMRTHENSSDGQMEYIIMLRKGSDPNYVKEIIYKNTAMQKTFNVNFEVLDNANPLRMSYKSYIQSFILNRQMTKFRLYCNKLQKVQTKLHKIETYIQVLQSGEIDNIIDVIKRQNEINDDELIEYLINKLGFTDVQVKFIVDANIKQLSKGYLSKYIEDAVSLRQMRDEYMNKITNENVIMQEIVDELLFYRQKYGKPRMAKVISKAEVNDIPQGEFKIVVTYNNFIKKVPVNDTIGSFKDDEPKFIIRVQNTENILLFDENGKVFKLPVHKIPVSVRNSNGTDIRTIVKRLTSNICAVLYEPKLKELSEKQRKYFITVLTKGGNIKKLDIDDFLAVPPSGIIYIKLDPNDIVNTVLPIAFDLDIIVYSKNKALRMNLNEVPHQKRNTKGMRAMIEPEVDGLSIVYPDTTDIVVITENGYINRFSVLALPNIGRNKAGSKVINIGKTDSIKCIFGLRDIDGLRIVTRNDRFDIPVNTLEPGSSVSKGKKVIPMKNDNIIHCQVIKQQ